MNADDLLPVNTSMGPVTLFVGDLDAMTAWYRDVVALDVLAIQPADDAVALGRGTTPLIILEHRPSLAPAAHGAAGLFHTAILFNSQANQAASVHSIATKAPSAFTGSADQLVSQAFYFTDPE